MIIGVDRSGDESNFPIVYVAVELSDGNFLRKVRKLVNKRDKRKAMRRELKSTDLLDSELQYVLDNFKGRFNYKIVTNKEYESFKNRYIREGNYAKKLAYACYKKLLLPLVNEKSEIWLCKDFDKHTMKNFQHRLKHEFGVNVVISNHEGNVMIADLLAGAIKRKI
jgi:hypothetical protein